MNRLEDLARNVSVGMFREVIKELLLPLFPGASLDSGFSDQLPRRNRRELATKVAPGNELKLMPHEESVYCCSIRRLQRFSKGELFVVRRLLGSLGRTYRDWESSYKLDTSASVMSEVVAGCATSEFAGLVGKLISTQTAWSQQTYEGDRIAFSVGIDGDAVGSGVSLQSILNEDFLKVLSNGHDTLIVVTPGGEISQHETLTLPETSGEIMAPIRLEGVAAWTMGGAGRVVVALNRNGELLVFKDGQVLFARRRGEWRYFAHDSVISGFVNNGMASGSSREFRREIYRTLLDAAFARSGACIGVVNASRAVDGVRDLVDDADQHHSAAKGLKAKALIRLIGDRSFQELDRRFRLELVSIDGATVIDHSGKILAVGAILKIGQGSAGGGGREAASKALAAHGLGIKVSNDGYIRATNKDGEVIVQMA